jgi:intron-binding protein aquarius
MKGKLCIIGIICRYLLRLGAGEKDLDTAQDFSKYGRVNYMLERRLLLLNEVKKLSQSLSVNIYSEFTCETTEIFFKYHIVSRWEEYLQEISKPKIAAKTIGENFPFKEYLPLSGFFVQDPKFKYFGDSDPEVERERALAYWDLIENMFLELEECRAFELLRSNKERANYLISKQARIIAMTCTHAALKRKDLRDIQFEYDNLIIEEAGQILEIETFIPLTLQKKGSKKNSKVKRIVLLGTIHLLILIL